MRALACESWECKATRYVLVSKKDLQPAWVEWKDIGLWRRERRVERVVLKAQRMGFCLDWSTPRLRTRHNCPAQQLTFPVLGVYGVISKTVPQPSPLQLEALVPPVGVVPYKFPEASTIKPA
jgi:hypothetical protein